VSGFLPTIIKGLGYTNADAQSAVVCVSVGQKLTSFRLFTVPPYAVAFVTMYLMSAVCELQSCTGLIYVFSTGIRPLEDAWALRSGRFHHRPSGLGYPSHSVAQQPCSLLWMHLHCHRGLLLDPTCAVMGC
jgi:hypothetical protein